MWPQNSGQKIIEWHATCYACARMRAPACSPQTHAMGSILRHLASTERLENGRDELSIGKGSNRLKTQARRLKTHSYKKANIAEAAALRPKNNYYCFTTNAYTRARAPFSLRRPPMPLNENQRSERRRRPLKRIAQDRRSPLA